jgi:hypothetical protein
MVSFTDSAREVGKLTNKNVRSRTKIVVLEAMANPSFMGDEVRLVPRFLPSWLLLWVVWDNTIIMMIYYAYALRDLFVGWGLMKEKKTGEYWNACKVNVVTSNDRILKYIKVILVLPCKWLCILVLRVCLESISKIMITYRFFRKTMTQQNAEHDHPSFPLLPSARHNVCLIK